MISIFWSAATLSAALPSWFRPRTAFEHGQAEDHEPRRELLQRDDADGRGAEQDELHQVPVLAQERLPAWLLLRLRELVRADLLTAPPDLDRLEPCSGRRRAARTPPPPSGRAIPSARLGHPGSPPRPCRRSQELRQPTATPGRSSGWETPGVERTCAKERRTASSPSGTFIMRCDTETSAKHAAHRRQRVVECRRPTMCYLSLINLIPFATNGGRAVGSARGGS